MVQSSTYTQLTGELENKIETKFGNITTKTRTGDEKLKDYIGLHMIISGTVQRVFFRDSTLSKVNQIGKNLITGWVRNLPISKQVEIYAETLRSDEGKQAMKDFVTWCFKDGSEPADEVGIYSELTTKRKVDCMEITFSDVLNGRQYDSFERKPTPW